MVHGGGVPLCLHDLAQTVVAVGEHVVFEPDHLFQPGLRTAVRRLGRAREGRWDGWEREGRQGRRKGAWIGWDAFQLTPSNASASPTVCRRSPRSPHLRNNKIEHIYKKKKGSAELAILI